MVKRLPRGNGNGAPVMQQQLNEMTKEILVTFSCNMLPPYLLHDSSRCPHTLSFETDARGDTVHVDFAAKECSANTVLSLCKLFRPARLAFVAFQVV